MYASPQYLDIVILYIKITSVTIAGHRREDAVSTTWEPTTYLRYDSERSRPFLDLLARVRTAEVSRIVDVGCGPGHLSALLRSRWPAAQVLGIDSSVQMIERARAEDQDPRTTYECADLRDWHPEQPVDLLVSNAALQWVPGHLDLLPGLAETVAPAGALAISVPSNFDAPSHVILHELSGRAPYAEHVPADGHASATGAQEFLDVLARPGWRADAWETTYLHVLSGPDPVFEWIRGTGARPVLQSLPDQLLERFTTEYKARLREAYPERAYGTVLPFKRTFVVAHREDA
jgi:trans-aconitate 2-methyltransferase